MLIIYKYSYYKNIISANIMTYNLTVNFDSGIFFFESTLDTIDKSLDNSGYDSDFGPGCDSDYEPDPDELSKSFTLHNLTNEFIRGVYTVLYDIEYNESNFNTLELVSNINPDDIKFPFDNILIRYVGAFDEYLDPDTLDDPTMKRDIDSMNIIDYYNKYWKRYILHGDIKHQHNTKIPTKRYVLQFEWSGLSYILQCDTLDYINGILSAMSWLNTSRNVPHHNLLYIHDNHRLSRINIKYSIGVKNHDMEYFNKILSILDHILILPLINIIHEYIISICQGNNSGLYVSEDKLDLIRPETFIKCDTICELDQRLCPVCRKDRSFINESNIYTASVSLEVV